MNASAGSDSTRISALFEKNNTLAEKIYEYKTAVANCITQNQLDPVDDGVSKLVEELSSHSAYTSKDHANTCHELFRQCLNRDDPVFIRPEMPEEDDEDGASVRFSLLTPKMLKYDMLSYAALRELKSEWFNTPFGTLGEGEQSVRMFEVLGYRPYFFEFRAQKPKGEDEFGSSEWNFLRACIRNYKEQAPTNYSSQWFLARILPDNGRDKDEDTISETDHASVDLVGEVLFSASPFVWKRKTLRIDTIPSKTRFRTASAAPKNPSNLVAQLCESFPITTYSPKQGQQYAQNALHNAMLERVTCIDVLNVGTANCILLRNREGSALHDQVLYDVGVDLQERRHARYTWFENYAKSIDAKVVILSHWDLDHVVGCTFLKDEMFYRPWIAPDINKLKLNKTSAGARRVARYLSHIKQLYPVALRGQAIASISLINTSKRLNMNQSLVISQGSSRYASPNDTGLTLYLADAIGAYRSAVLLGDVSYQFLPSGVLQAIASCDYLVIPHHCSNMNMQKLSQQVSLNTKGNRFAIACSRLTQPEFDHIRACFKSGKPKNAEYLAREKSHPVHTSGEHITMLENGQFTVIPTGEGGTRIRLRLSSKSPIAPYMSREPWKL